MTMVHLTHLSMCSSFALRVTKESSHYTIDIQSHVYILEYLSPALIVNQAFQLVRVSINRIRVTYMCNDDIGQ